MRDNKIAIKAFDDYIKSVNWLEETGLPVAVTLTENLEPAEGKDAVIFPPTFAVDKRAEHPYQIDVIQPDVSPAAAKPDEEVNNCLIDSVGSQANRIESEFKREPLSDLVPQINVELKTKKENEDVTISANLLDIGHRIADGAVRFSGLRDDAQQAIRTLMNEANAAPLAKLAPTSLVFGFWDSRPGTTMFKFGRIFASTIRATNVAVIKRSAQFNPAFDPALIGLAEEALEEGEQSQETDTSGKAADGKDPMSKLGLRAAPAVNTHGGVRVYGSIVRRTQINLVGLRALAAKGDDSNDQEETLKLRRYLFGLALVAARCQNHYKLREGCLLIRSGAPQAQLVYTDGRRVDFPFDASDILAYAQQAAEAFGVGESKTFSLDARRAKDGVAEVKKAAEAKKKTKK